MSYFNVPSGGGAGVVTSVTGTNGVTAAPTTGAVVVSGVNATTSTVGVASFNPNEFTVTVGGQVSLTQFQLATNYTNVTTTPYVVTATDYYISVDTSGGAKTIQLPNAPTALRLFVVKDRTGNAGANNISITTVGGAVLIDGVTTYTLMQNFEAVDILFNGTSYEIF